MIKRMKTNQRKMTLAKFKNAIKRAKALRHEIWKDEMEELDRTAFGYYVCKR